jgi:3',5'-cyclic AMP phosphodiesterase CpdA
MSMDQSDMPSLATILVTHHHPLSVPGGLELHEKAMTIAKNSNYLLEFCKQHGVLLLLHGHKHIPYVWVGRDDKTLIIISGGHSCDSWIITVDEYNMLPKPDGNYDPPVDPSEIDTNSPSINTTKDKVRILPGYSFNEISLLEGQRRLAGVQITNIIMYKVILKDGTTQTRYRSIAGEVVRMSQ